MTDCQPNTAVYMSSYIPIGTSKVHYKCMMIDCELDSHIPKQVHAGFSLALQNPNHNNAPYEISDHANQKQSNTILVLKKKIISGPHTSSC